MFLMGLVTDKNQAARRAGHFELGKDPQAEVDYRLAVQKHDAMVFSLKILQDIRGSRYHYGGIIRLLEQAINIITYLIVGDEQERTGSLGRDHFELCGHFFTTATLSIIKPAFNTVFGFRFSVKKTRIISKLKLKFVALETELGIIPPSFKGGSGGIFQYCPLVTQST